MAEPFGMKCRKEMAFLVMSDFCYAFSRGLVDKLKKMMKEDRVFQGGNEKARKNPTLFMDLTPLAEVLAAKLGNQISWESSFNNWNNMKKLISVAEEFLAIFEE